MNRLAKWIYSVGFFLAMCGLLAAGTYQYKDNLSIPYNINLFTCGSASCTSMVLQNSAGAELFNGANPGAVLATIQNILVSPISVGIAPGSSPVNVTGNFTATATITSPAAMNLVQVQNGNIASPQTYGVAPVGSVEGVNAFVTNNVNVTPPTPLNVTVGNLASPQGVAVVNNVAVTTPTPLQVTLPASPLSVGIAGPSPLQVTLPATPISVGIAGPTPLNVTVGGIVSPLNITLSGSPITVAQSQTPQNVTLATGLNITQIAGNNIASPTGYGTAPVGSVQGVNAFVTNNVNVTPPTPLQVTLPGTPLNVTVAGPTPLNVTVGGIVSPQGVTIAGPTPLQITLPASPISVGIAGPTPLSVAVTPAVQAMTVANPSSATTAYTVTSAFAVTGTAIALGATPGIVGIHQLGTIYCAASTPFATPGAAYVQVFDATPHASGSDVALSSCTTTCSLPALTLAVSGTPVQVTNIPGLPPPGLQFNHGITVAFTLGSFKSATAVAQTVNCSFGYN